jgi:putative membrane protein
MVLSVSHAIQRLADERNRRSGKVWMGMVSTWLMVWIVTPVVLGIAGEGAFALMATLGVLTQAAATLITMALRWPIRRVMGIGIAVAITAWLIELMGSTLGVPFGHYDYTPVLQPQPGSVPLLIPLAWLMMLGPAWGLTALILEPFLDRLEGWRLPIFAALAGLVFTAWDLYLDPQMVGYGLWVWENPSGYFGIPWSNFAGWWLSAALITLLVRPTDLPRRHLALIYTLTWALQALALGVFWGQPGPALAGFIGMGLFVLWGWKQERTP